MSTKKTIIFLRHAKASAALADMDDHARPLAPKGIEEAQYTAKQLKKSGLVPDLILCSDAKRTIQTCEQLAASWGHVTETQLSKKLYLATPGDILSIIAQVPDRYATLMIIGHNPGLHELAAAMAHEGDAALLRELAIDFSTATAAVISYDTAHWSDISAASGVLLALIKP